ncbi:MAG: hypothetical protein N2050_05050 [Flavobacteriales bacterium]|nr:hypothetical protein [Flavobacteriales bacterium]MCX7649901.1 hypothetical protein [Flavobacteriales bacterium]MDW8432958.1 hypothetical protein [Flavobacteriales bacterium]
MSTTEEIKVSTPRTGRLFRLGEPQTAGAHWLVFHGYGQLGPYFLKHFQPMAPPCCFWCPEALNRFYLEGLSGRVGAGWMTREAREDDIQDNIQYLDRVYHDHIQPFLQNSALNILAFSQGVATACRWVQKSAPNLDKLILWSGMLPHDMSVGNLRQVLTNHRTTLVYGTQDPYMQDENLKAVSEFMLKEAPEVPVVSHPGGHHFDPSLLSQLILN